MTLDQFIINFILPVLALGIILAFARLARGPDLPDRVISLDLMASLIICLAAAYSIAADEPAFLDAAIVLSLVVFVGTVAFAYYLRRRRNADTDR
ncbi:cation:proton antiporter [Geobacter sp. DSM 9736]|uniref:cation:proton antiporter n=1 Tax=Geobacter sp. DSM 9736 TaxID=1277350 RepID=UPI000B504986|nr:cation:proton antiporter [Geobacter sp. DSM 9736]SNB46893.1 multisubunit sodium/proton antiporter, MrpF subunit [Geobacter sp. DSM 9736]